MPHEGIWCDGGRCVCVLRASGVIGVSVFVVSGVMWVAVGGSLV